MTFLVERLAELSLYIEHLRRIREGVTVDRLASELSVRNDVLFSLQTVAQLVIDIAGELCARAGIRFEDYTSAVRGLSSTGSFPPDLVERLARLPGFRNVLVHEYVNLDYDRVIAALADLEPIERFAEIVAKIEAG